MDQQRSIHLKVCTYYRIKAPDMIDSTITKIFTVIICTYVGRHGVQSGLQKGGEGNVSSRQFTWRQRSLTGVKIKVVL